MNQSAAATQAHSAGTKDMPCWSLVLTGDSADILPGATFTGTFHPPDRLDTHMSGTYSPGFQKLSLGTASLSPLGQSGLSWSTDRWFRATFLRATLPECETSGHKVPKTVSYSLLSIERDRPKGRNEELNLVHAQDSCITLFSGINSRGCYPARYVVLIPLQPPQPLHITLKLSSRPRGAKNYEEKSMTFALTFDGETLIAASDQAPCTNYPRQMRLGYEFEHE